MKRLLAAVTLAVAVSLVAPLKANAAGSDPNRKATFVGAIHVSGKKATLSVRYQCASGQTVWVSAK
jgi:hypothetical protein